MQSCFKFCKYALRMLGNNFTLALSFCTLHTTDYGIQTTVYRLRQTKLLHIDRLVQSLTLLTFCSYLILLLNVFYVRIKLSNVAIGKSNVSLLPEHGLRITADKASGNIGAVWHYKESSWFVFLTIYYLLIETFFMLIHVDNK